MLKFLSSCNGIEWMLSAVIVLYWFTMSLCPQSLIGQIKHFSDLWTFIHSFLYAFPSPSISVRSLHWQYYVSKHCKHCMSNMSITDSWIFMSIDGLFQREPTSRRKKNSEKSTESTEVPKYRKKYIVFAKMVIPNLFSAYTTLKFNNASITLFCCLGKSMICLFFLYNYTIVAFSFMCTLDSFYLFFWSYDSLFVF